MIKECTQHFQGPVGFESVVSQNQINGSTPDTHALTDKAREVSTLKAENK